MKVIIIIAFSFLVALILGILPLPHWANWFRPQWVLLVLIFWLLMMPYRIGFGMALIVGLFEDLLKGTLLGEYALIYIVVSYFIIKLHARLRLFPLWQQSLVIFFLILLAQLMKFVIQSIQGQFPGTFLYWLSPLISAILWPWVFSILKSYRERYRLA